MFLLYWLKRRIFNREPLSPFHMPDNFPASFSFFLSSFRVSLYHSRLRYPAVPRDGLQYNNLKTDTSPFCPNTVSRLPWNGQHSLQRRGVFPEISRSIFLYRAEVRANIPIHMRQNDPQIVHIAERFLLNLCFNSCSSPLSLICAKYFICITNPSPYFYFLLSLCRYLILSSLGICSAEYRRCSAHLSVSAGFKSTAAS